MEYLQEHSMAPLYHLLDKHHVCDPNWYHKRNRELLTKIMTIPESITEANDDGGELDDDKVDDAKISIATPPTTNIIINDDGYLVDDDRSENVGGDW